MTRDNRARKLPRLRLSRGARQHSQQRLQELKPEGPTRANLSAHALDGRHAAGGAPDQRAVRVERRAPPAVLITVLEVGGLRTGAGIERCPPPPPNKVLLKSVNRAPQATETVSLRTKNISSRSVRPRPSPARPVSSPTARTNMTNS